MIGTHLDIFSGIGGFAIAARAAGFKTVAFCESDSRCREFLEKTWGLPVEPDIRQLDGKRYAGISLLTGGPPCQPASRAGKQGGVGDDRWLWLEALRVLDEAKPDCVVFENPPGILDVGIDGILSEMGRSGYEVQCFDIPACAVDSPQLRHRIWIVGFRKGGHGEAKRERVESCVSDAARIGSREVGTESDAARRICTGENRFDMADVARDSERGIRETAGTDRERVGQSGQPDGGDMARTGRERSWQDEQEREPEGRAVDRRDCANELADAECERRNFGSEQQPGESTEHRRSGLTGDSAWSNAIWVPCADGKLRRAPDDSFDLVDGLHRSLLGALGNSICPQVATQILMSVAEVLL